MYLKSEEITMKLKNIKMKYNVWKIFYGLLINISLLIRYKKTQQTTTVRWALNVECEERNLMNGSYNGFESGNKANEYKIHLLNNNINKHKIRFPIQIINYVISN